MQIFTAHLTMISIKLKRISTAIKIHYSSIKGINTDKTTPTVRPKNYTRRKKSYRQYIKYDSIYMNFQKREK